jgi:hypothetical protein
MSLATVPEINFFDPTIPPTHQLAELSWSPSAVDPATASPVAAPSPEAIAKEAYALYEARGCQDGWDVEDWLAAEESLRQRALES